ncbi:hypothetical protein BGZ99_004719 [Dissophora globulifera]|uniref:Mediator complex subunit 16 C-terminal domain-containing protein n=1 Tax=Dissophora globulifera TaxID=979702 RepID=A0A9P6UUL8_9FUNG|nr:hypothetical protein BGZ99_004719 [Dissophora globulifera]
MNPSLRMLSMLLGAEGKARLWDTCMEDISMFHGQSHITHVLWNHSGNYFTTIDEKGKLIIWANKRYLNAWLPVYMIVLFNPVICCEWINPERMYVTSKLDGATKYERERTGRPRNPLALIVLTSDGQLTTLYKPAGQVFTHISTNLPHRSAAEDLISSRITHGSMLSSSSGLHLVTHNGNALPAVINLYQIDLRFSPEVVFCCDALAILHISNPLTGLGSAMAPSVVHHLQLLPQTSTGPYSVAVALAARDETLQGEISYRSQVIVWDVTPRLMGFHSAFQELSTRRNDAVSGQPSLTFVMLGERRFEEKFISALAYVPRSRELVVGFSDGSLLGLESRFSGLADATPTLLDGFSVERSNCPIVAVCPSPNGFALLCSSLSGRVFSVDTTETSGYDLDLETSVQQAVLALLNEWDYSDLVSVVAKAARVACDNQLPDRFLEGVFRSYDMIKGAEDSSMIEPFMPRASVMRRMLSLQLVLLQALPQKLVQYRVTCALLHLQSIGEVFTGCCISDPATLAAHLDHGSNVATGQKPLAFDTKSLWSLFPLCGWVLDFCTVLFRELAFFLNMKSAPSHGATSDVSPNTPDGQSPGSSATGMNSPSIVCFLYHNRARKTLRSVLVLLEQFHQYVRVREQLYLRVVQTGGAIEGAAGQSNHTNSMTIYEAVTMKDIQIATLSQYVESTFTRCPLKVGVVKSMLRDLNGIGNHVDLARINAGAGAVHRPGESTELDKTASEHAIFIKGLIPSSSSNALAQAKTELRMITRRYPTLWDMNRLVFATLHWLDLEPASSLTDFKAGSRQKSLAMHPSRCRIDPVTALKTRQPGANGSSSVGRHPLNASQHQSLNVNSSNMPMGSRGSISSASGKVGMPTKVFTESPNELSFPQQGGQQRHASISQPFPDVSSTMATSGSNSLGGPTDLASLSISSPQSIWGIALDDSDSETDGDQGNQTEDAENLKSIWHNWSSNLQGQYQAGSGSSFRDGGNEDNIEPTNDDVFMEDDGDDEDEERDTDDDMQDTTVFGSGRNGKGDVHRGRRLSTTVLTPSSQWLLKESQIAARKTQSEWTLFPLLSEERSSAIAAMGSAETKNRLLGILGLDGHVAPMELMPTEYQAHSQLEIEAQVRKRRFGIDPIRKVKKYKTTGNGRRCIRCLQVSTNNNTSVKPLQKRPLPHQSGSSPITIPDIAAATLWYHNYDRSCICGGMWLEL